MCSFCFLCTTQGVADPSVASSIGQSCSDVTKKHQPRHGVTVSPENGHSRRPGGGERLCQSVLATSTLCSSSKEQRVSRGDTTQAVGLLLRKARGDGTETAMETNSPCVVVSRPPPPPPSAAAARQHCAAHPHVCLGTTCHVCCVRRGDQQVCCCCCWFPGA